MPAELRTLELFLLILSEAMKIVNIILMLQRGKMEAQRGDGSQELQSWDSSLDWAEPGACSRTTSWVTGRCSYLAEGLTQEEFRYCPGKKNLYVGCPKVGRGHRRKMTSLRAGT